MNEADVIELLAAQCREAGGQSAWAKAHGVSPQFVHDLLNGRRLVSDKIAAALGLQRVVTFEYVKDGKTREGGE